VREAAERAHDLLVRAVGLAAGQGAVAERLREEAVLVALPYAHRLAGRYRNRGEPSEDVTQVACLALVKAVRAYRPGLGHGFVAFAAPTILGEIRRYFRDNAWGLRVPRRLQELDIRIRAAIPVLTQVLGRWPTDRDLARYLQVTDGEINDARAAGLQYRPVSLSLPIARDEATLGDLIGEADRDLEATSDRLALRQLMAALPERDQTLLNLRFAAGLTQTQIADRLGVSQMQVSRLLRHAITRLRHDLIGDATPG
jgi:RNA polymerase sigma-B factor